MNSLTSFTCSGVYKLSDEVAFSCTPGLCLTVLLEAFEFELVVFSVLLVLALLLVLLLVLALLELFTFQATQQSQDSQTFSWP